MSFSLSRRKILLLLLSSAVLWWLAGAFNLFPLAWIALAPFFFALKDLEGRARFKTAYLGGFGAFFLINWWLIPTITFGAPAIGAPQTLGFLLSVVAVVFIAAVHGLQPALVALLASKKWFSPFLMALGWVFWDWLRCQTIFAHSWGALAFSQTADLPLLQIASVFGQHGLTFVCIFCALTLAHGFKTQKWAPLASAVLLLIVAHGWGFWRLQSPSPARASWRLLLVQTDVSSLVKTVGGGESPFQQAFRLTREASENQKFDLIVWPETTCDWMNGNSAPPPNSGSQILSPNGLEWQQWKLLGPKIPLLAGAQTQNSRSGERLRFNDAALIPPRGEVTGRAKERLVPFGERAPLGEWLPFLRNFSQDPPLARRPNEAALSLNGRKIAPVICFESCFPQPAARLAKNSDLLAVITNDEWFAGTEAPRQHFAMSVLRAVENGIPLVQVANGGESGVCDERGRVLAHLGFGEARALPFELRGGPE